MGLLRRRDRAVGGNVALEHMWGVAWRFGVLMVIFYALRIMVAYLYDWSRGEELSKGIERAYLDDPLFTALAIPSMIFSVISYVASRRLRE